MTKEPYIIVGAGGHARVLADALLIMGANVKGFTDNNPARHGATLCGLPVLGGDDVLQSIDRKTTWLVNGLGCTDNHKPSIRWSVQKALMAEGWRFASVIHPSACISPFALLGLGVQIMAGSVVHAAARIGDGVILNTCSIVEHDAIIGDWSHLAPGATVCGQVQLGEFSLIGAGAVIRQGVSLGSRCLVGAGAAVIHDSSGDVVLVGVPARPQEKKQ